MQRQYFRGSFQTLFLLPALVRINIVVYSCVLCCLTSIFQRRACLSLPPSVCLHSTIQVYRSPSANTFRDDPLCRASLVMRLMYRVLFSGTSHFITVLTQLFR